jgi:hypothetical protein
VGDAKWEVSITATVAADTKFVAAWWTDLDRREEVFAKLRKRHYSDFSVEESYTGSTRIRDMRCKTSRGSFVHSRLEYDLGPDGAIGTWSGDRFSLVGRGFTHRRSAAGALESVQDWNHIMTFLSTNQGATEIVGTFNGRSVEVDWLKRFLLPLSMRVAFKRQFRDRAKRCEQAMQTP